MARNNPFAKWIAGVGGNTVTALTNFGRFWMFSATASSYALPDLVSVRGWRHLLPQAFSIGTRSVPVVMLTGAFVGMVLIVQGWSQFETAGLAEHLGAIVNMSVAAELGPVLAGVMLAGRVGGALTAELGTMNVTEQLLALRSMGTHPVHYLVTPRFLACMLLAPLLTCYADLMGALGAWLIYTGYYGGESEPYWRYTSEVVTLWDLGTGIVKAIFFGGAIGLVGCYKGFNCRPGAEGVGRACTEAFVVSFIAILILDFVLNVVINKFYEIWYGFRSLI